MQDKIFYTICFGFLSGVLLRSFVFVDFYFIFCVFLVSGAVVLFLAMSSAKQWGFLISILVVSASLGVLRFHVADVPPPQVFESRVGAKITFSGIVVDEPAMTERSQRLTVFVQADERETKMLLSADFGADIRYGDEISFTGTLKKPEDFLTDQGKLFDYIHYLRKDGILYTISYAQIEILSRGHGSPLKRALFFVKEKFLAHIDGVIPPPESLLMGGLILGERSAFSEDLRQSFVDTGTIHIIALSGYNVTIVARWLMRLLAFVPVFFRYGAGICAIILFILMAGASSTAIRAGIMAVLALFARATGRDYDVARALVFAAALMVLLNPFILAYDVSFQLSFLATVAVVFFAPRIENYFVWIPKAFDLREIFSMTVAAYAFVLPFLLYNMGNLSLVALPANFLVLPFIPVTMIAGFATGLLGFVSRILSLPAGIVAELLLHYELATIDFFARLPFASITVAKFPLLLAIFIYAWFAYFLFGSEMKRFLKETN